MKIFWQLIVENLHLVQKKNEKMTETVWIVVGCIGGILVLGLCIYAVKNRWFGYKPIPLTKNETTIWNEPGFGEEEVENPLDESMSIIGYPFTESVSITPHFEKDQHGVAFRSAYMNDDATIYHDITKLMTDLIKADGSKSTLFLQRYSDILVRAHVNRIPLDTITTFRQSFKNLFGSIKYQDLNFAEERIAFRELLQYNDLQTDEITAQYMRILNNTKATLSDQIHFQDEFLVYLKQTDEDSDEEYYFDD